MKEEFLKKFKKSEELTDFITSIRKRGVVQLLEGEMDAHLGYDKNQKSSYWNARNGYSKKRIKTDEGEFDIQVPRDREASFEPQIVPKRKSMVEGLEDVIVSLYARGCLRVILKNRSRIFTVILFQHLRFLGSLIE